MMRYKIMIMGLLLIMATIISIGLAETETTYYIYDDAGWRVCSDSEAIFAQDAFKVEYPVSLSRDEMESLLLSHQPFIHSYGRDQFVTPEPTPTPAPTPAPKPAWTPAPVPEGYWKSIIGNDLPSRDYNLPSRWLNRFR